MSLQLQMLFSKAEEKQQETRAIQAMIKEALEKSTSYQTALSERVAVSEKLKQIEIAVKSEFMKDLDNLDALKVDLKSDKEIMADLALNQYKNGEPIEVKDKFGNLYEPIFKVSFKKIKAKEQVEIPEKLSF